jgi:hypothetical protein
MKRWHCSPHFLTTCNNNVRNFRRGISLHGHTHHSREYLGFVKHHISAVPIVAQIVGYGLARYRRDHGEDLDFNRAYWTAPLSAREAYELERKQIEGTLGLQGLVSLTDHDDIEGPMELTESGGQPAVVSLEWTVPFQAAYFHLGVHNLPRAQARNLTAMLLAYTQSPDERQLPGLLQTLDQIPDVLLVLNHPYWEMEPIGKHVLHEMLHTFLRGYGKYIHAFEINGLRPWNENQQTLQMAEDLGIPVVSGGDRHGCEASAILNLTCAESFSEFVAEVRQEGRSEIVVMPSYQKEPLGLRLMQVAWDVLREYPGRTDGPPEWFERVFFECDDGTVRPLSRCFRAGIAGEIKFLTGVMRQLERQPWRSLLQAVWSLHSTNQAIPPQTRTVQPAGRPAFTDGEGSMV